MEGRDLEIGSETTASLLSNNERMDFGTDPRPKSGPRYLLSATLWGLTIVNVLIFIFNAYLRMDAVNACFKMHSHYSPGNNFIDREYKLIQFNGTLDFPSPYRGPPSPAVDDAWQKLIYFPPMALTKDQVTKAKLRLDSVRYPPEIGQDLYMGSPEVTHQLHCLNFLRKATYEDYYRDKSGEWTDSPATTRIHLDHCIEMLRQVLMCNADTGVLTMNWIEAHSQPYPNFNTWHKCRNFDSVMDWVRDSALQLRHPGNATTWPQVPGSVILATPP